MTTRADSKHAWVTAAVLVAVGGAASTLAQPAMRDDRPTVAPTRQPGLTPEEGRVGLPASAVDPVAAVLGPEPGEPAPTLRREGDFLVSQPGRAHYDAAQQRWVFTFLPTPEAAAENADAEADFEAALANDGDDPAATDAPVVAMVLQPCQRLATIEQLVADAAGPARLTLSGQVNTYRGVNYLLPTALTGYAVDLPDVPAAADEPGPADGTIAAGGSGGSGGDVRATMAAMAAQRETAGPSGAAPARRFDEAGAGFVAGADASSTGDQYGVAPNEPTAALRPDGDLLVNRAGRVVRSIEGGAVLFAFEGDGSAMNEAPMILLPSRWREVMEDTVVDLGDGVVFEVTGRVYAYGGSNYLLPMVVRQVLDR